MSALVIDAFEFSRLKEHREGVIPVADLTRLADELASHSGTLHWVLTGGAHHSGHAKLSLGVAGSLQIMCQRCLTPFAFDIDSESVLILAKDEVAADEIDALLDDDQIDVIVGTKGLDILQLVEDEALLAMPLSPKHAVCPDTSAVDAFKSSKKESPFAMLRNLK
ncbi:YceD family protein [Glaciimonas sp. GG7]